MTQDQTKTIEALSGMSKDRIDDLRLRLTNLFHLAPNIQGTEEWVFLLNKASERKQEFYWADFEDVTDNPIGI